MKSIVNDVRAPRDLQPFPGNPRRHSAEQLEQIGLAIRTFGFTAPIVIDETNTVLAGHARMLAAQRLKLDEVPVRVMTGLTETEKLAVVISDNRLSDKADYDEMTYARDLEQLLAADVDVFALGFNEAELDAILKPAREAVAVEEVDVSQVRDVFWVNITGPLIDQAAVLQRMQQLLADFPDLSVKVGALRDQDR